MRCVQALSPGELARVVRGIIGQFRDETVRSEVRRREQEAAEAVMEATESVLVEEEARINQIRAEAEEIYERYRVELRDITNRLNAELEPLDERLETIHQAIREKLDVLDPELPPLPEPEVDPNDEGWLFDSRREYLTQLDHYHGRDVPSHAP